MPTTEDLRAAYALLKDQAPSEISVTNGPHRTPGHNRRRIYLPVVVAATVIAAITGTVVVANSNRSSTRQADAGAPSTSSPPAIVAAFVTAYPFSVATLPDGLRAVDSSTSLHSDVMGIESSHGGDAGLITVSDQSVGRPAMPRDAVPVKVGSETGYYGRVDTARAVASTGAAGAEPTSEGVVWRDPSGLWASVVGVATGPEAGGQAAPGSGLVALSETQLVAIANATQIGTPHAAKVPLKLSYLPAGFEGLNTSVAFGPSLTQGFDPGMITVGQSGGTANADGSPTVLDIGVGRADQKTSGGSGAAITIGEFSGRYSPDANTVSLHDAHGVSIFVSRADSTAGIPLDELAKIVQGLTVASGPNDPSTWFDAATALP